MDSFLLELESREPIDSLEADVTVQLRERSTAPPAESSESFFSENPPVLTEAEVDAVKPEHRDAFLTYFQLAYDTRAALLDPSTPGALTQFACNLAEALKWCRHDLARFASALLARCGSQELACLAAVVFNAREISEVLIQLFKAADLNQDHAVSHSELDAVGLSKAFADSGISVADAEEPLSFSDWVRLIGNANPFAVATANRLRHLASPDLEMPPPHYWQDLC